MAARRNGSRTSGSRPLICWAVALALVLWSASAAGEDAAKAPTKASAPTPHADWAPPDPSPKEYDWIQLNTHEWLKGKIKLIQEDTIFFDSDKLDDLEFDWDDIALLVTAKKHTFRFTNHRTLQGTGEMRGDVIRIRVEDGIKEFKRSDLVSMVPGAGRERDYWSGNLGIALAGQAGNTSQLSVSTSLAVARETTSRKASLLYSGTVATQQNALSANTHRLSAGTSFYFTRRFFVNLPRFEYFQDEFQNIQWRITPTAGVGYDVVWEKKVKWQLGGAAGFQAVKFYSVDSGNDRSNDFPLLFLMRLDIDLPKRFEWESLYQLQVITTQIGNSNQHLSSTLSFDFWGPMDFDTTFQWDWVAQPQQDDGGRVPNRSDYRISVGFSLNL